MWGRSTAVRRLGLAVAAIAALSLTGVGIAAASNVAVGLTDSRGDIAVPTWLYLASGGGTVGAVALLTMLVTDREFIDSYHDSAREASIASGRQIGELLLGTLGVVGLVFVVAIGFVGPQIGQVSAAVLVTFVGARALLTMFAYTVGNPWPALNPWRRIADVVPNGFATYPDRLASWPAVGALLVLIWIELIAPLSSSPRALSIAILGYTAFTIAGAVVFTPAVWFRKADPLSVWFRCYGSVAPIQRTDDGLTLRPPGARLSDDDVLTDLSGAAFAIVLVWELTYSGFVVTPPGVWTVEALVGLGLPPALVYLGLLLVGFVAFCWVYWIAAGLTRARAETYVSQRYLAIRFAPPLFAIAAGYHFAHFVGFSISLWPSLVDSLLTPLSAPVNPTVLGLTPWFGYVEIAGILLGHVLAVWVAHTVAFELFPGKLQSIRSQYPFVAVMICFTMVSLWLQALPDMPAAYVPG
ncbi:hypothetical protein [Natronoglomus mannanivorans]|uniref:Uncharacterized protein n=1 Tax=Natronoglomus mannanivorans TaxID=2979990 RepID=A0AAP2YY45_9EURY|nr:hypothetical protein [Halobacteria archaeon AArc-xg1-1]